VRRRSGQISREDSRGASANESFPSDVGLSKGIFFAR
jgi:hypothetical protein